MKKEYGVLIYLLSCALNGIQPDKDIFDDADMAVVFNIASQHMVAAMAASALDVYFKDGSIDPKLKERWMKADSVSVYKSILFKAERAKILGFMEQNGIWYMPLKGILIEQMYPKIGMREMADNDILYDGTYQNEVSQYMESIGYEAGTCKDSYHDKYSKKPAMNFELHTYLYPRRKNSVIADYYEDSQRLMIKEDGKEYSYRMSDEDHYIYYVAHMEKHYDNKGTGLRALTDMYVLRKNFKDFDRSYVDEELKKLGIAEFEQTLFALTEKLLTSPVLLDEIKLSEDESDMLTRILLCGAYGTRTSWTDSKLRKYQSGRDTIKVTTKIKYFWDCFFPSIDHMRAFSPIAQKHSWTIPFLYVYRIFRALTVKRKEYVDEFKFIKDFKGMYDGDKQNE